MKIQTNISLDHELKKEFKKTGLQLSNFVEEKIREELNPERQIQTYKQKIKEHKNEIKYLEQRIIELTKKHGQSNLYGVGEVDEHVERAVNTCINIYDQHKIIGDNQIKDICTIQDVNVMAVKTKLKLKDIPIIPTYHPPKQTSAKNVF